MGDLFEAKGGAAGTARAHSESTSAPEFEVRTPAGKAVPRRLAHSIAWDTLKGSVASLLHSAQTSLTFSFLLCNPTRIVFSPP
jgi:hypothetical protein